MDRMGQLLSLPQVSEMELAQTKCIVTYCLAGLGPPARQIKILEKKHILAARGGSGHRTWSGALHLGHFLCAHTNITRGRRILELGAGTGYISILCAKFLGAAHVTASEGNEQIFESMSENIALNNCAYSQGASADDNITPKLFEWGKGFPVTKEPVDLVLGADITYDQNANPALVSTLRQVLNLYPCAEVVLSVTERNVKTLSLFRDCCHQNQLQIEVLEHSVGRLDETDQSNTTCAPFYHSSAPIRIYRISDGEGLVAAAWKCANAT